MRSLPRTMSALAVLFALLCWSSGYAEDSFYIQPYLQNVRETGVTVTWWTDGSEATSQVEYGEGFKETAKADDECILLAGKFRHQAVVSGVFLPHRPASRSAIFFADGRKRPLRPAGRPADEVFFAGRKRLAKTLLLPEKTYKYRVRSGSLVSAEYTFHTAVGRSSGFGFVVLGDGRTEDDKVIARHRAITKVALQQGPAFAFHCGDFVDTGDQTHWERFWRRIATASDPADPGVPFASQIPYYLVVGNHEIYSAEGRYGSGNLTTTMARFQAYVDNPPNGSANPSWEKRYYAFSYGVATFIVLDANNTSDEKYDNHYELSRGSTPDWEPGSEQYNWMLRQLNEARARSAFTFVLMHPAPFCRGTHGKPSEPQSGWQIGALDPVFRKFGVDGVFCSHDHLVERCLTGPAGYEGKMDETDPANLNYIVMGNSGHAARPAEPGWEKWMSVKGDGGPPYYTKYFYDWAGSEHCSLLDAQIEDRGGGRWTVRFRIVREDGAVFDAFSLERADPLWRLLQP